MPLLFDYPLEQLKTYKGTNPRPADFDAFWDKGLAEMQPSLFYGHGRFAHTRQTDSPEKD